MGTPEEQRDIELETIEINHHLDMGEALIRLRTNPDFQKVILEGYCKEKALASVSLLGVPQISENGKRAGVMEDLVSISNLQYFFLTIDNFYEGAKNPVLSDEEEAALESEE
jgi:hypothetical protein